MIRQNVVMFVSWVGHGFHIFVLLCNPASSILHWYTLPDKSISSVPLHSVPAVSDTDCQNQCEAAAGPERCRSVNFNSSAGWCQLFNISAIGTALEDGTGISIYESCPMRWVNGSIYWFMSLHAPMASSSSCPKLAFPDSSKVHVAHMGPTWVLSAPGRPHVGPMNLAIRVVRHWIYLR